MSGQRLLETSLPDERDSRIDELKAELRTAQRRAGDAEREAERAREDATRALGALRAQLSPLYRALQAVFGELDTVTSDMPQVDRPSTNRTSPVWDAWKSKLPPSCGKIIDALLIHGELNGQQIRVAAQMGKDTMYGAITKLNKAGVLTKNGGRFRLKEL
jgi:chromosome segregation ATPase